MPRANARLQGSKSCSCASDEHGADNLRATCRLAERRVAADDSARSRLLRRPLPGVADRARSRADPMGDRARAALPRRRRHVRRHGCAEVPARDASRNQRDAVAALGRVRRQAAFLLSERRGSLRQRPRAFQAGAVNSGSHWAAVGERGGVWGLKFMFAAYRLLGRGVFTALLYPVVAYFYVTGRSARRASHDYLSAVRLRLAREGRPEPPGMNVFHHVVAFGHGLVDKLAMWAGVLPASSLDLADVQVLKQFTAGRGVLFIGSHHGNLEVLRAFGEQIQGLKVHTLVSTANSPNWIRVMQAVSPQMLENMIQIDSLGPDAIMALRDKLEAGEHVCILSDRLSVKHAERSIHAPFL